MPRINIQMNSAVDIYFEFNKTILLLLSKAQKYSHSPIIKRIYNRAILAKNADRSILARYACGLITKYADKLINFSDETAQNIEDYIPEIKRAKQKIENKENKDNDDTLFLSVLQELPNIYLSSPKEIKQEIQLDLLNVVEAAIKYKDAGGEISYINI